MLSKPGKVQPRPPGSGDSPLPDVLVVTWTVDEGHALSRVLTPGKDSRNDYQSYTHNFAAIARKMRKGARRCRQSVWARTGPRPSATNRS